jgi:hypothetical protein
MADLEPATTAPTQLEQSVAIGATILEEVPIDETAFDETVPPVFGSPDSEDEWDENDFAHENLMRPTIRKKPSKLLRLCVEVILRLTSTQ